VEEKLAILGGAAKYDASWRLPAVPSGPLGGKGIGDEGGILPWLGAGAVASACQDLLPILHLMSLVINESSNVGGRSGSGDRRYLSLQSRHYIEGLFSPPIIACAINDGEIVEVGESLARTRLRVIH
jgi:hypothetical protein